jgi:hypothetical protein
MHSTPYVTMTAEQFSTVFQVTKEFPGVLGDMVMEAGFPAHAPPDILELARHVRRCLPAGPVEVRFTSPGGPEGGRTLRIAGPAEEQGVGVGSTQEFPEATGRLWRELIDLAVATLGGRELLFRTGFMKDEVDSAAAPLDSLFHCR